MGFWKFCSNLSSLIDLRDALINQVEFIILNRLLLRAAVSTTIEYLITTVLQGASTSLILSNINYLMCNDVAWVWIFGESTK